MAPGELILLQQKATHPRQDQLYVIYFFLKETQTFVEMEIRKELVREINVIEIHYKTISKTNKNEKIKILFL